MIIWTLLKAFNDKSIILLFYYYEFWRISKYPLPVTKDPTAPPIARHDPIHEASSSVIDNPNSSCLSFDIRVADNPILQPHPNVEEAAAKVAKICQHTGDTTIVSRYVYDVRNL